MKSALIIFAREPKDGKTKTRLLKDIPVKTVTNLYKNFVEIILKVAKNSSCTERFLYYAGHGAYIPFLRLFENKFILKKQLGKDLGTRMHRALIHCDKEGFQKMIIIGTDCLTLNSKDIQQAFEKLDHFDCVLGPSKDGGYYLIALTKPQPTLFKDISWSTSTVLEQTLQKIKSLNKTYHLLRKQEDIDTMESLKRFYKKYHAGVDSTKNFAYTDIFKTLNSLKRVFLHG